MEKININLFDNLFSFINEIEQVGNNKEKIKEIKNKKIQEIKKPFNQLCKNISSLFKNISEEIENLIYNYYYEKLNDKMNFKEKESLFDKNYENLKRNEKIIYLTNEINKNIEIIKQINGIINNESLNKQEEIGKINNKIIESMKESENKNKEEEIKKKPLRKKI